MNFIKIKNFFLLILSVPVFILIANLLISFTNQPDIKNLNIPDMTDFSFNTNSIDESSKNIKTTPDFEYKLIGYRSGNIDSSVILKKGNKEFVVAKGEKLEGVYELVEVTKDEIVFRNQEKLYKIENLVGINL
jgi:type II secretory pathway component PulC|tara:strand:+ start:294 stop:692 length:399 start_codon:yes stop_codon:yes gene_type:complete